MRQGEDNFSFTDRDGNTVTECIAFTHYYDGSGNHIGGVETRNGETTIFGEDYTPGAKSRDLTGVTDTINSAETYGLAFEF